MTRMHARVCYTLTEREIELYLREYQVLNAIRWVDVFDEKDAIELWKIIQKNITHHQPQLTLDAVIERIRSSDTLFTLLLDVWIASAHKSTINPLGDWFLNQIIKKRDTTQ